MNIELLFYALNNEEKEKLFSVYLNWKKINVVDKKECEISLTPIKEWILTKPNISKRLSNNLLFGSWGGTPPFDFVEQVNKLEFMKIRNAGEGSWNEFVKLRGY